MKKISKGETEKEIKNFFENIRDKSAKQVKKIKKLAMGQNIKLKEKKRAFCKYCLTPFNGKEKVRIRNKVKTIECINCKKISRIKL